MDLNLEYIEQLTLDELAGTITDKEKDYLYSIIATSTPALQAYTSMRNRYPAESVQKLKAELPNRLSADSVLIVAKRGRGKILYIRYVTGIAAAILLIVFVFKWLIPEEKQQPLASPAINTIQLQITGNQAIDLTHQQGSVTAGNVVLNNVNKTLSYSSNIDVNTTTWATIMVPPGKDYTLQLSDGSEIQLNAATKLKFPLTFNGKSREVYLTGEAFFKVAKNATKPFYVHLPNSTITVLGTSFNINTYENNVEKVSLVEGSVKMASLKDSMKLKPGNSIRYTPEFGMQMSPFDERETLSWRRGIYLFHNATLREVSEVLPRWFGGAVVIENPAISGKRFTGLIDRNKPIERSLDILKATNGMDYTIRGDTIYLK